ncbi:(2Fe-2S)-binding protein [Mycobacterium sp. ITM-2017-0098]|nr:(2Fe-2S)-binding protein [Mycobacterium sp. ITM-2017-0098]
MNPRLTRKQFVVSAGLAGIAVGASACAGYGQPSAGPAAEATATAPPPGVTGTPIAVTADVPVGSGVIIEDIVVTQPTAGVFRAFSAVCTHAGCALAEVSAGTINCPCHGSKFNLDGTVANGPATRPLEGKSVTVNGDVIAVG